MKRNIPQMHQSILVLQGEGKLQYEETVMEIKEGDSIYLPKGVGTYEVEGKLQLLLSEG